jgi:hypothetical protein
MKIKFVSYDGAYPNLCGGTLVMVINNKKYKFGEEKNLLPSFWTSTGGIAHSGDWALYINKNDLKDYPEEIRDIEIFEKMIDLMNEKIEEKPCCSGCI